MQPRTIEINNEIKLADIDRAIQCIKNARWEYQKLIFGRLGPPWKALLYFSVIIGFIVFSGRALNQADGDVRTSAWMAAGLTLALIITQSILKLCFFPFLRDQEYYLAHALAANPYAAMLEERRRTAPVAVPMNAAAAELAANAAAPEAIVEVAPVVAAPVNLLLRGIVNHPAIDTISQLFPSSDDRNIPLGDAISRLQEIRAVYERRQFPQVNTGPAFFNVPPQAFVNPAQAQPYTPPAYVPPPSASTAASATAPAEIPRLRAIN